MSRELHFSPGSLKNPGLISPVLLLMVHWREGLRAVAPRNDASPVVFT